MDLYGSDLRLSDIGLGEDQMEREYPLDMLDHHLGNPYLTGAERTTGGLGSASSAAESGAGGHCSTAAHGHNDLIDFQLAGPLDSNWFDTFLDEGVFQDSLIADEFAHQPGGVKGEHSYSLADAANNPLDLSMPFDVKLETDKDVELFGTIDQDLTVLTGPCSDPDDLAMTRNASSIDLDLAEPATPDLIPMMPSPGEEEQEELVDCVKVEPQDVEDCTTDTTYASIDSGTYDLINLPPTPPCSSGSSSSSDSEAGGLTPTRSSPPSPLNSPYARQMSVRHNQSLWGSTLQQPVFNNPISSNGVVFLTEEEKRTLIAEGYPLPTKLPLSKQEEKNLKKIRRKIKNKISAQESRRKKKEYLETLEKKVETVSQENSHLKKKVDILETNNRSLVSQLQRLQGLANKLGSSQTGTCVMVN